MEGAVPLYFLGQVVGRETLHHLVLFIPVTWGGQLKPVHLRVGCLTKGSLETIVLLEFRLRNQPWLLSLCDRLRDKVGFAVEDGAEEKLEFLRELV